MTAIQSKDFVQTMRDLHLLTPAQLLKLTAALQDKPTEPRRVADDLVKHGWLTAFQARILLEGRGKSLVMGPYLLLDRIGQGGMGQVFKARHQLMNRIVALKVINKDRLKNPDAVARFQREIQSLAKLSHPHVVLAHDAAQVGALTILAMEFVEGFDLGKLLSQRGPLPVAEACSYARQTALGLQHAHEHGLVHRDIKPGNLLVAGKPDDPWQRRVVKILDLGLARLRPSLSDGSANEITQEGAVMGTPDYIAPEQAVDSTKADIRADLYSLGCTLYTLLAGQVPFPGGSLTQKLLSHQQKAPASIQSLRPDAPPALAAVLERLMAKNPRDRYQTPMEAAAALTPLCHDTAERAAPIAAETVTFQHSQATVTAGLAAPTIAMARPKSRRWLLVGGILGGMLALALVVLLALNLFNRPAVNVVVQNPPPTGPGPGQLAPPVNVNVQANANASAEVIVRLDGVPANPDPKSVFLLDNRPVTLDDLKKDLKVPVGKHELVVKVENVIVAIYHFVVAEFDAGLAVALRPAAIAENDPEVTELRRYLGHDSPVRGVAFFPDGRRVLSTEYHGDLHQNGRGYVWDVNRDKEVATLVGGNENGVSSCFQSVALLPRGDFALFGCHHANFPYGHPARLVLWDFKAGKQVKTLFVDKNTISCVALSSNGLRLLTSCDSGLIRMWDTITWDEIRRFDGDTACFAPHVGRVLTAKEKDVFLWNPDKAGKELHRFLGHEAKITSVACSPDGKWAVSGSHDKTARIWDLQTGKEAFCLKGHDAPVLAVAITPDGRRALTAGQDKTIRLWDAATGTELHRYTGHDGPVLCLATSPGGRMLLSGSQDKTARLWGLPK